MRLVDRIRSGNRLINAVGEGLAEDILWQGYERVLVKVTPDGNVTYQLIDSNGYVITGSSGVFNP